MNRLRTIRPIAIAVTLAFAVGCSDTTGLNDTGSVTVTLQQVSDAQAVDGWYASLVGVAGSLDPDTVLSLTVTVTELEFLVGATGDGITNTSWTGIELPVPLAVDLMALPAEGDSPLVIAAGSVPVGDYRHVRLYVSDPTIEFAGPIAIGEAHTFDKEFPYFVEIPSVEQTGITTDLTFTVADDVTDIQLLFDPAATLANVTANGAGAVMLTPIIRATIRSGT